MRVALVHDYLTQYGGAERVLEALHGMFPTAPVFTSVTHLPSLPPQFASWEIRNSPLQHAPGATRSPRIYLPLFPAVFRSFSRALREFDLVIADSSAWSHGVMVRQGAKLICYCHSPARFLYGDQAYLKPARLPPVAQQILPPVLAGLRRLDRQSAQRVDRYIANSENVAARIHAAYGRTARVIYPPVDVARLIDSDVIVEPESWYLVVSRLVPHKRVDLTIDACQEVGAALKIIGDGRAADALRKRAGPNVEFSGRLSDEEVFDYLRRCRALILPAAEDFGMTAVEAQAAGRPVIAFGQGGALESVVDGETGLFFREQSPSSLAEAIRRFEYSTWSPASARANARRFSLEQFRQGMEEEIAAAFTG